MCSASLAVLQDFVLRYVDPQQCFLNQQYISALMAAGLALALLARLLRLRPAWLDAWDPGLRPFLARELVVRRARGVLTGVLLVVALVSSVNYFYGSRNNGTYVHRWDAYHTAIGAKYFNELGYFELYRCTLVVDAEEARNLRSVRELRNLHTRGHEKRREHLKDNDCRGRFTEARWKQFAMDVEVFSAWMSAPRWRSLFRDKGFNGTPVYAVVSRALIGATGISRDSMLALSLLDPLLMLGAFAAVAWAYGLRVASLVAIFFCVFFPNRFVHMGGSILRFDYVAALFFAFAALKKERWGLAGLCLAWATMERIFPAVFAGGVFLKLGADWLESRSWKPEHLRFAACFFGLTLFLFLVSLLSLKDGWQAWEGWAENMRLHNMKTAGFRVGFKHLFMFDGELGHAHFGRMQGLFEQRRVFYVIGVLSLLGPIGLNVRRLDLLTFSALFGVCAFFTLTVATRYYYGVVALLFLVDRRIFQNRYFLILGALLFAGNLFSFEYYGIRSNDAVLYNGVVSLQLAVAFTLIASWLISGGPLLDWGDDPRFPEHVPAASAFSREIEDALYAEPPFASPEADEAADESSNKNEP